MPMRSQSVCMKERPFYQSTRCVQMWIQEDPGAERGKEYWGGGEDWGEVVISYLRKREEELCRELLQQEGQEARVSKEFCGLWP